MKRSRVFKLLSKVTKFCPSVSIHYSKKFVSSVQKEIKLPTLQVAERKGIPLNSPHPASKNNKLLLTVYRKHILGTKKKCRTARSLVHYQDYIRLYRQAKKDYLVYRKMVYGWCYMNLGSCEKPQWVSGFYHPTSGTWTTLKGDEYLSIPYGGAK